MSSSNSKIPISSSWSISELIKHIRHSFLERDFVKVQTILMEREQDLKMEIEDLARDRIIAKQEVHLLERKGELAELKRLKLEDDLRKNRRNCEDLEEQVARLQEEIKMSKDREKRAELQRDNLFAVNTKMTLETNRSISELKTKNLENQRLIGEIEGLAREKKDADKMIVELREANKTANELKKKDSQEMEGLSREKVNALKTIEELRAKIEAANELKKKDSQEIEGLSREKVNALKTIEEMRAKIEAANELKKKDSQEIEGLSREKVNAFKTIEELRAKIEAVDELRNKEPQEIEGLAREKLDAFRTIKELRAEIDEMRKNASQSGKVAGLHKKTGEGISDRLTAENEKTSALARPYKRNSKLATSEERAILGFAGSVDKNDSSGSGTTPAATGKRKSVFPMKDDRNSAHPLTRGEDDDARNTIKTPRVSQLVHNSTRAESNKRKEPMDSGRGTLQAESNKQNETLDLGASANGMRLMPIARCSTKSTCPPSAGDVIEIIDSDDETNPDEKARSRNRVSEPNPGKKLRNLVQSPLSDKISKRNRTDSGEDFIANSSSKKRNMFPSDGNNVSIQRKENQTPKPMTDRTDCSSPKKCAGDKAGPAFGTQTLAEKHNNGLKDEDSESSDDDSLSDSRIGDLVASLRKKNIGKKFEYAANMLRDFQRDEEFCMSAVCALYRQEVVSRKLKGRSDSSKNRGFSPVDSVSGCALAEYLIDGDKEMRLRKSVLEVKKQQPDVISQCRKLAFNNVDKLFQIYCSGDDPLFRQS